MNRMSLDGTQTEVCATAYQQPVEQASEDGEKVPKPLADARGSESASHVHRYLPSRDRKGVGSSWHQRHA